MKNRLRGTAPCVLFAVAARLAGREDLSKIASLGAAPVVQIDAFLVPAPVPVSQWLARRSGLPLGARGSSTPPMWWEASPQSGA